MGLVTLIDVLKKLNLKLEAETEMRLQLEEKVDRQQQEPVPSLIYGPKDGPFIFSPDPKHFFTNNTQLRINNTSNASKEK